MHNNPFLLSTMDQQQWKDNHPSGRLVQIIGLINDRFLESAGNDDKVLDALRQRHGVAPFLFPSHTLFRVLAHHVLPDHEVLPTAHRYWNALHVDHRQTLIHYLFCYFTSPLAQQPSTSTPSTLLKIVRAFLTCAEQDPSFVLKHPFASYNSAGVLSSRTEDMMRTFQHGRYHPHRSPTLHDADTMDDFLNDLRDHVERWLSLGKIDPFWITVVTFLHDHHQVPMRNRPTTCCFSTLDATLHEDFWALSLIQSYEPWARLMMERQLLTESIGDSLRDKPQGLSFKKM